MPDLAAESPVEPTRPSIAEIFLGFFRISISGFGGVLLWSRRLIVDEKCWLTAEQFNELFALCQFMPGPNVVSLSLILGHRLRGWPGAFAATIGLLSPSVALMIALGALYQRFGTVPQLEKALGGLGAATAGLFIATALQMARPLAKLRLGPTHAICAATVLAVGVMRLPLPWVLVCIIPLSIGLSFRGLR